MNHLSQKDQQFVPISTVDNIINDIHHINDNIRKFNPENPSNIRVPPRLAESQTLKRSQSASGTQNRNSTIRDQQEIALRLSQLHSKVDRFISNSRENSPVRTLNRNLSMNKFSSPSKVTFADELIQRDVETEKRSNNIPMYKTATSFEITSPLKVEEVKRSGDWTSLGRPAESATIQLKTYLKNSSRFDGSPTKNSYLSNSPSRGILKQRSSFDRDASPLSNSVLSGSSPTRSPLKNSGNSFTSFVLSSTMGSTQTLYNKDKLNQIISGIKARQAVESHGYNSSPGVNSNKMYASYLEATRKPVSAKPGLIDNKETPRF